MKPRGEALVELGWASEVWLRLWLCLPVSARTTRTGKTRLLRGKGMEWAISKTDRKVAGVSDEHKHSRYRPG